MRIELTTVSRAGHPKTRAPPAGIVTLSDLTATWILV